MLSVFCRQANIPCISVIQHFWPVLVDPGRILFFNSAGRSCAKRTLMSVVPFRPLLRPRISGALYKTGDRITILRCWKKQAGRSYWHTTSQQAPTENKQSCRTGSAGDSLSPHLPRFSASPIFVEKKQGCGPKNPMLAVAGLQLILISVAVAHSLSLSTTTVFRNPPPSPRCRLRR